MKEYILLAGIHGVGKTYLSKVLTEYLDFDAFSISDLIRRAGTRIESTNKNTDQAYANQSLWKKELNEINSEKRYLVLDGHFCLLDSKQSIITLPEETFLGTNLKRIVLITQKPSIIQERLFNRDGVHYPLELLTEFQMSEIKAASAFSQNYQIPLFKYDESVSISELVNFFDY
ncbi:AAA family ATPase [Paenibacillus polymyxa]|uniref:AAA family ATPase n=1 Tax=Paenibacillus polymyxa TaxID=1406 RepID=UPI003F8B548C